MVKVLGSQFSPLLNFSIDAVQPDAVTSYLRAVRLHLTGAGTETVNRLSLKCRGANLVAGK